MATDLQLKLTLVFAAGLRLAVAVSSVVLCFLYLIPPIIYSLTYGVEDGVEAWYLSSIGIACVALLLAVPLWIFAPQLAGRAVAGARLERVAAPAGGDPSDQSAQIRNTRAGFVVRARIVVVGLLRIGGVLLGTVALCWSLTSWLIEGLTDGDLFDMYYYGTRLIVGAAFVVFGFVFAVFADRLARFFIIIPPNVCPGCRYNLESFRAERCPECGLHLGPDFHAPPSSEGTNP